jgi:predicted nucleic acid-binding protein
MAALVPDTSALVSLGIARGERPEPHQILFDEYEVFVPQRVVTELRDVASYDDEHGHAASAVLDRSDGWGTRHVSLDEGFPLDDGENAAVTLANEIDADVLLCDEFTSIGLVHASLADTRLVTTPTLLSVFVRSGVLEPDRAGALLETIATHRSWTDNSYVQRARTLLDE